MRISIDFNVAVIAMAFRVVRLRREARRNAKLDEIFQVSKFSANQDNNGFKVSSKWSLPLPATSVNSQFCRTGIQDKQGRLVGTR